MRASQLVFYFILALMMVGNVSAQPMNQSTTLLPADEQVTETTGSLANMLYDNLCSSPIDMTGSPTEIRTVEAGTCIEIDPNLSCPECGDGECACSVTITGPNKYYQQIWWDCHDGQPIPPSGPLCFYPPEGGDYTFEVDVCSGENGSIKCGSCCN